MSEKIRVEYNDDFDYEEDVNRAYKYLSNIISSLQTDNRFFPDSEFLEKLEKIFTSFEKTLRAGQKLYRARIYTEADKWERYWGSTLGEPFEGYNEKASFVNENNPWPAMGRMHPAGMHVLYAASHIETCIKELHPGLDDLMSVATIVLQKPLKIVDLSACHLIDTYLVNIAHYLTEMITRGNSERDYVFPQFIASYCRKLGYDGICYRSKYENHKIKNQGNNYCIFNYKDCKVISSELYKIPEVTVKIKRVAKREKG